MNDLVVKELIHFNIFSRGKNILNKLDATCGRTCMATPRDKYYMELLRNITDFNDCNGAPLSIEKIREATHRVIVEEEAYTHNKTVDTFRQTPAMPNTQGGNENMILTGEKQNKSDALAETLKGLTINDAGYY